VLTRQALNCLQHVFSPGCTFLFIHSFSLVVLESELKTLHLTGRQVFYHLSHTSSPFYYAFFLFFLSFSLIGGLGFELKAYTLSHSTSPFFVMDFFQNRVSPTICLGWPRTTILSLSPE
jgi:hypothetical protein